MFTFSRSVNEYPVSFIVKVLLETKRVKEQIRGVSSAAVFEEYCERTVHLQQQATF